MQKSADIGALLFDLGNVIWKVDMMPAFAYWATFMGMDAEQLASRFQIDCFYEQHERGEISDEAYFDCLVRSMGVSIPYEEFCAGWERILREEIPGVVDLLVLLKERLPLYAFSNTNELHRAAWPERYGRAIGCFQRVFCSHEIGMRKPEKRSFLHVCREIQMDPERVLFFDDADVNVAGARSAGLQAARVSCCGDIVEALRRHGIEE